MRSRVRALARKPVFAIAAILTVAIGTGANIALFGVIYSVLLRPLPFRDPARLVQIWETHRALPQLQAAMPDVEDWRAQSHSFEGIAAYTLAAMNHGTLVGQGEPAAVHATMAGSNLFPLMGIHPLLGRAFTPAEEQRVDRVAILSEQLWRTKFAASPTVIGRQIRIDTESFRVVGVVPRAQSFPEWADLWIPLSLAEPDLRTRRKYHPLETIARLKPGVTPEQAQAEIQTIARRLAQSYPDTNGAVGAYVIPLSSELTGSIRPSLLLAWAAVALVLLIACANLAHLFLARIAERTHEIAIRQALGAGRWQLLRHLLAESFLLTAIGSIAGVLFAVWTLQLARHAAAAQFPRADSVSFDAPVWLFALAIALLAGLLFGLPASWRAVRPNPGLSTGGRSIVPGRSRLGAFLLAGEVALALLVISGAALLVRSFAALLHEDPGFKTAQVWSVPNLPLPRGFDALDPALRAVPGVIDVAAVNAAPMTLGASEHSRFATRFGIEGRVFDVGSFPVAQTRWTTPDYFRVIGVPMKSGRTLTASDSDQSHIVINETLARRFFPNGQAVGKRLVLGVMDPKQNLQEIVGVVGDVRDFGLDQQVEPTFYAISSTPVMTILVKTAGPTLDAAALRDAIRRMDPDVAIPRLRPLQGNLDDSLARRRFVLILIAILGAMAAFLTAAGIYGLLSQSVNARLREFGVRSALGAAPAELIQMILREALLLTLPGLTAGALIAAAFTDPISITTAALAVLFLTCASAWLPARRAAATDPAVALRAD